MLLIISFCLLTCSDGGGPHLTRGLADPVGSRRSIRCPARSQDRGCWAKRNAGDNSTNRCGTGNGTDTAGPLDGVSTFLYSLRMQPCWQLHETE